MEPTEPSNDQTFVADARSLFSPLQSEISARNNRIQENDQYIYSDKLDRMLDIPVGHDFTGVNWLRRTVEIHRSQFMGKGFGIDSSYIAEDVSDSGQNSQNAVGNPELQKQQQAEKTRLIIENQKKKAYAEIRRKLIAAIIRDNGGNAFWADAAENASAIGDTIIKGWYDKDQKKYILQQIETVDNFYALWSRDDYRSFDAVAYIYQISKQEAMNRYEVPDTVQTSPLGSPLAVLNPANLVQFISTQPMVTVMELTGKIEGWCSKAGTLYPCDIGDENEINVVVVGDVVQQVIDKETDIPKYYILPNKRQRRRPWGLSDVTTAAININLTYIEALSDWRTVSSKVNFPKFKAYGFPIGVQPPKPKARTVEFLPLAQGQDIQPITMGQSAQAAESDFPRQLQEMENQFVREVGISRQLFDLPDTTSNSNPAQLTAMKSVSDITNAKRELWEPILRSIFEDALHTIAAHDSNINEVVEQDTDWYIKISWPSALNADDPSYHAMLLNQFNTNVMSVQTLLEKLGYDKQEIDRIREEMEDPVLAAMHGHLLNELAQYKIIPYGTPAPPKVNINLRGDLAPGQQANLATQEPLLANGPFPVMEGPQGNAGLTATDNFYNQNDIAGDNPTGGTPIGHLPAQAGGQPGQPPQGQGGPANGAASPQSPQLVNTKGANTAPGAGIMSQPGTGAPAASPQGNLNKHKQRRGK